MSGAARGKGGRAATPIEHSLLLTATLCLLALGCVMVFSASSATSLLGDGGDSAEYLKRTLAFAAVGLVGMRIASVRGLAIARALTPLLVGLSLLLLLAVLVPGLGRSVNGAQSWLGAGWLQFQPAEVAKFTIVLYGAHLLASEPKRARSLEGLAPFLLLSGACLALIVVQPDLGTAMVTVFGVGCLLFAAGVRPRTLLPVVAVIAVAGLATVATHPHQQERLTGFLDPGADPEGAGFQSRQAAIALGSGGVMGVGLGESVQKAFYLPESHTDMIAAVLGEEAGLIGMLVLIALLGMFGYAGFRAAHRARDRYAKLLATGLTSMILAQAVVNMFAVLGLAPLTGVPLPFVSYGGTSLVVSLLAAGLILNVARGPASAAKRPASASQRRGGRPAGKLRVLEGGGEKRRRRAGTGTSRNSGRRHGGPRRAGDRGRRRAAR